MPVLPAPRYVPPIPFRSGNIASIYPPLFRPTPAMTPRPERIETPDGDFLDLDHHPCRIGKSKRLAIISHGLEGNARRKYTLGMARMVTGAGFDAVCWTQRGAGQTPNRKARSYHSGETEDLNTVLTHCLETGEYEQVVLIGFSMGGNQILKYLGEAPHRLPSELSASVTFSVPVDLSASERTIALPSRKVYFEYFMRGLRKKVRTKARLFPDEISESDLAGITTLRQFDDRFTAPNNGFADAEEYYTRSSSKQFLNAIPIPTLLVNAQNDPFLPDECYPVDEADANSALFLEMPRYGGHVGFVQAGEGNVYWSEQRAGRFLREIIS